MLNFFLVSFRKVLQNNWKCCSISKREKVPNDFVLVIDKRQFCFIRIQSSFLLHTHRNFSPFDIFLIEFPRFCRHSPYSASRHIIIQYRTVIMYPEHNWLQHWNVSNNTCQLNGWVDFIIFIEEWNALLINNSNCWRCKGEKTELMVYFISTWSHIFHSVCFFMTRVGKLTVKNEIKDKMFDSEARSK